MARTAVDRPPPVAARLQTEAALAVSPVRRRRARRLSNVPLHLMLVPGVILVLVYQYVPMAGIIIAFQDFVPALGPFKSAWVGLDNFRLIMALPNTVQIVKNTLFIASMKVVFQILTPLVFALLLNEARMAFRRVIQTIVYLPHFLSWVILGGILIDILSPTHGIVNQALGAMGIGPIYFLGDNDWFPYTLVGTDVWKEFGFGTIIFIAAMSTISPSLYEAASVDGASRIRQMWHVTLPGVSPIIILVATLSLGNVLNAGFEQVLVLYSPQVYASGDIIDTFVYRTGLIDAQYGLATAFGLFRSVVSFLLISVAYLCAYRFARYRIF